MHRLTDPFASERKLTQSLIQTAQMLGLVRAEVGRVLGYKCAEFTALFEGHALLQQGTFAYAQAVFFIRFYQALYDYAAGNEARMVNWMRRHHQEFGNAPFYLIIDEGRLAEVVAWLERQEVHDATSDH